MSHRLSSVAREALPRIALLVSLLAGLLLSGQPAAAQQPKPGNHGQAAIEQLGLRLPAVARQYNMAPERLHSLFLSDPTLAVDEQGQLLYLDDFLPQGPAPESAAATTPLAPFLDSQTFLLHSLPGATKVIYLDFDGHTTTGTYWNSGYSATIVSAPFNVDGVAGFSSAELEEIQFIWQRVAEDYLPYGVDVTTQDPGLEALRKYGFGDQKWGQRVVISPSSSWFGNYGGVAYVGSFNWNTDTPCFVFSNNLGPNVEKYVAEAASHEAGHTVGLNHDGVSGGDAYYAGHGDWAPIMGVGYYRSLVQWSKGEYANANNTEDDLTIMTGYGFTFRPDDHGNSIASASELTVTGTTVSGKGIIERTTDRDYFSFLTGAGTVTLNITPATRDPDLDILAELTDSAGTPIPSSNPAGLSASISADLPAGTYYLAIDGAGAGDPTTGYSDYGSLGEFNISGTIVNPATLQPPAAPSALAAAAASSSQIDLTWTDNATDETGFEIERLDGSSWVQIATQGANTQSYSDTGLAAGTAYQYRVRATNASGDSAYSDAASATTLSAFSVPSAPSNLSATAASRSQINLSWTDTSGNEDGVKIERCKGSGCTSFVQIATVGLGVTTYSNTGLSANTYYRYRVRAYNTSGNSAYSNMANVKTPRS